MLAVKSAQHQPSDETNKDTRSQRHQTAFECRHCSRSFRRKWVLQRHERSHDDWCDYPCTFKGCDRTGPKGFYRKDHLLAHQQTHRDKTPETLQQPGPDPRFGEESSDNPQQNCVPSNIRCESPNAKFGTLSNPSKHHQVTFPCCDCGKRFNRKDSLRRHARIHDPEGPKFPCGFQGCVKAFYRSDRLLAHQRKMHTDKVSQRSQQPRDPQYGEASSHNPQRDEHWRRIL